ncbi:MAG: hypothetical protein OEL55_03205 [Desulfobulbaceae bacterium]|nr:hypothetical protein [Desulfobulbaceae bacterium]
MIIRILVAAILGGILWFGETVLTCVPDFMSVVFAGIIGTFVSGAVALIFSFCFLPVLLTSAWDKWKRLWWIPAVTFAVAIVFLVIARLPFMVTEGTHPEFVTELVYTANPWFGMGGYFLILLSVVTFPYLGVTKTRKWI